MDSKFSPRLNEVLSYSREEAIRLGHNAIGPEHFLLGILREGNGSAIMILKAFKLLMYQKLVCFSKILLMMLVLR